MTLSLLDLSRAIPRPVLGAPMPAERLKRRTHPAVERAAIRGLVRDPAGSGWFAGAANVEPTPRFLPTGDAPAPSPTSGLLGIWWPLSNLTESELYGDH
jgi:hypothetical protein